MCRYALDRKSVLEGKLPITEHGSLVTVHPPAYCTKGQYDFAPRDNSQTRRPRLSLRPEEYTTPLEKLKAAGQMATNEITRTVVVVEDDESMIKALQRLLQAGGFRPQAFSSAEALLQSDATSGAACFIFDIHLPGLSGLELRQRLAESGFEQPVIFMTAHDEPFTREAAERSGAFAFLIKPFPGRSLLDAVRRALQPKPPDSKPKR